MDAGETTRNFAMAPKRLESSTDIQSDREDISRFVSHILANGVGMLRVIKHFNHLTVPSRVYEALFSFFSNNYAHIGLSVGITGLVGQLETMKMSRPPYFDKVAGREPRSVERPRDRPREFTKVKCSDCGKECEVPFKPTAGRPVYCNDCMKKHRPPRA